MKKIITGLCAVTAAATVSLTAFASPLSQEATRIDRSSDPQKADTQITTSIEPSYVVTIPQDTSVAFNALTTNFGSVELTSARIGVGKSIGVSVSSDCKLKNADDNSKVIPYRISGEAKDVSSEDVTKTAFSLAAAGEKIDLVINITQDDWDKAYAGKYSDIVTFEISYR